MKKFFLTGVLACCLSACIFPQGQLNSNYDLKSKRTSVFVIGVEPGNYGITLWPGSIKQGYFIQSSFRGAVHSGLPNNGYVVGRATAGDVLGLSSIELKTKDLKESLIIQRICANQNIPVISMPGGKVIYVGDLVFSNERGVLEFETTYNIEKARRFVDENYPELAGRLEASSSSWGNMKSSCEDYPSIIYRN